MKGAIGTYPPKSGKMIGPGDNVTPGMRVTARLKEVTVYLEVQNQIDPDLYSAKVLFFEPPGVPVPPGIQQDDIVSILRDNICWLHETK